MSGMDSTAISLEGGRKKREREREERKKITRLVWLSGTIAVVVALFLCTIHRNSPILQICTPNADVVLRKKKPKKGKNEKRKEMVALSKLTFQL